MLLSLFTFTFCNGCLSELNSTWVWIWTEVHLCGTFDLHLSDKHDLNQFEMVPVGPVMCPTLNVDILISNSFSHFFQFEVCFQISVISPWQLHVKQSHHQKRQPWLEDHVFNSTAMMLQFLQFYYFPLWRFEFLLTQRYNPINKTDISFWAKHIFENVIYFLLCVSVLNSLI